MSETLASIHFRLQPRLRDQAGEERQIDFLRTIHGLDTEEVRNTAIEVELTEPRRPRRLRPIPVGALEAIPNDARLGEAFFAEQLPRIRAGAGR
jgi:hypothetical protein